ncbi:MAG: glycerophosphodiester phosphodiesterase family protein [Bryobacterales bacterium]|nr:glycerophosphodiester phosphodiesterase family protein [Bryobacterales bacterium]
MTWRLVVLLMLVSSLFAQSKRIVVIAHRGEHLHHPENTIAAYQGAVDAGADYFELDVRTTSDGKFVLMHDRTADRTTNGHGPIAEMTFDQVRSLEVGLKMGPQWAGTRVPTFDEALAFAHGKIGVYIDSKQISAAETIAAIERHNMQNRVVIYGGFPYLKEIAAQRHTWRIMPEADNPERLRAMMAEVPLKVVAFSGRDFNDETIRVAREAKADIYVDRLGAADTPAQWQDAIDRGATGIQTNYPAELVEYLKSKGYR